MTNADNPAGSAGDAGGNSGAGASNPLGDLPPRIRVHALAKLLGTTSKSVLGTLGELGESARSPQSSVSREVAGRVAEEVGHTFEQAPVAELSAPAKQPAEEPPEEPAEEPAGQAAEGTAEQAAGESDSRQPSRGLAPALFAAQEAPRSAPQPAAAEAEQARQQPSQPPATAPPSAVFLPPEPAPKPTPKPAASVQSEQERPGGAPESSGSAEEQDSPSSDASSQEAADDADSRRRRRRGRRGRGRGKGTDEASGDEQSQSTNAGQPSATSSNGQTDQEQPAHRQASKERSAGGPDSGDDPSGKQRGDDSSAGAEATDTESPSRKRRRRRRKKGAASDEAGSGDGSANAAEHAGDGDAAEDQVRSVRGSTRLEAKRQRRRDGKESGRKRAPVLSESEFLARRESVERTMVVKESADSGHGKKAAKDRTTQIAVLEDGMLVEHFVTSSGAGSIVGNVYLGKVQNVLPSMEAAFVDIGRGRNAVLYAGEVDWDAAGLEGKSRKIEQALETGDNVLVQVTKDPAGHKGARLTTQISLPGRFLVYVPGGGATGISRKLAENERRRLKDILKRVVPEDSGAIIRTASEGISESELERDVRRLQAQWEVIRDKAGSTDGSSTKKGAPVLLYEEPDMLIKVVRDLFTEDFNSLVVQGSVAWETVDAYVQHVAPDLADRLKRYSGNGNVFADYRIDEQITKALDRKVWLPSGGYLVIDRTEAMTVIDVNTGKFTGSGGNLEETVTKNNLESAEEIVRQLRLRDIGGIVVIDFIDMVLESNRDLVLRRLTECLGRDRTRHQVAEVTSLGLVQMTRKRIGTGLLEAFSHSCEQCKGRGVVVSSQPQQHAGAPAEGGKQGKQRGKGKSEAGGKGDSTPVAPEPTPQQRESAVTAVQAMANASKIAPAKAQSGKDAEPGQQHEGEHARQPDTSGARGADGGGPAADAVTHDGDSSVPNEPAQSMSPTASSEQSASEELSAGEPQSEGARSGDPQTGEPQTGEPETVAEVPAPADRTVRRRARRAASRPAGPPVEAGTPAGSAGDVPQ